MQIINNSTSGTIGSWALLGAMLLGLGCPNASLPKPPLQKKSGKLASQVIDNKKNNNLPLVPQTLDLNKEENKNKETQLQLEEYLRNRRMQEEQDLAYARMLSDIWAREERAQQIPPLPPSPPAPPLPRQVFLDPAPPVEPFPPLPPPPPQPPRVQPFIAAFQNNDGTCFRNAAIQNWLALERFNDQISDQPIKGEVTQELMQIRGTYLAHANRGDRNPISLTNYRHTREAFGREIGGRGGNPLDVVQHLLFNIQGDYPDLFTHWVALRQTSTEELGQEAWQQIISDPRFPLTPYVILLIDNPDLGPLSANERGRIPMGFTDPRLNGNHYRLISAALPCTYQHRDREQHVVAVRKVGQLWYLINDRFITQETPGDIEQWVSRGGAVQKPGLGWSLNFNAPAVLIYQLDDR